MDGFHRTGTRVDIRNLLCSGCVRALRCVSPWAEGSPVGGLAVLGRAAYGANGLEARPRASRDAPVRQRLVANYTCLVATLSVWTGRRDGRLYSMVTGQTGEGRVMAGSGMTVAATTPTGARPGCRGAGKCRANCKADWAGATCRFRLVPWSVGFECRDNVAVWRREAHGSRRNVGVVLTPPGGGKWRGRDVAHAGILRDNRTE
ncbi:hypothetical protein LXA43DRAFT_713365 [Ganoderma leucocontextum]|nr:hypothetical protein LXA43DRAFT_713365 [Ganoderma leucocontextum]